ncbi:MAG: hypothetical protein ACJA2S_002961 [Cyclobacteriaceae bacterium]|jgi:hypothetical protein
MTFTVNYDRKLYLRDSKRFLVYSNFRRIREFSGLLIISIILLTLYLLNNHGAISFFPKFIYLSLIGALGGFSIMFLFDLVFIIRALINIQNTAKNLSQKEETLILTKTHIEFIWKRSSFSCFWNSYNKAVLFKDVLFLIPEKRGAMLVRMNKIEISEGGFSLIKKEAEKHYNIENKDIN